MPPYDINREPILSRLRRDTTLTKPTPATWLYTGIGALLGLLLGLTSERIWLSNVTKPTASCWLSTSHASEAARH